MRRVLRIVGVAAGLIAGAGLLLWTTGRRETESLSRRAADERAGAAERGALVLEGAGFGGVSLHALQRNALPWRVVAAALVLDEQARDPDAPPSQTTLDRVLARFGFLQPVVMEGVQPPAPRPRAGLPLGFTSGDVAPVGGLKIRVANLGCAACHAGVTYAASGAPRPERVRLGMPNTSLDLEAYTLAVFHALRRHAGSERLLPTAEALFPEMDRRERISLRLVVMPLVRSRLADLDGAERPLPFPNGGPGSTNGVAALKARFELPTGTADAGFVSIPDLGHRVWRTSLLADGAYATPGAALQAATTAEHLKPARLRALAAITTFFTVPSMGVHPDRARGDVDDAADVMAYLAAYRPQRFPGPVDRAAAQAGAAHYAQQCAVCHGDYRETPRGPELVRFPNWLGEVGTDPLRAAMFDADLKQAVEGTGYRNTIAVQTGRGYAAPPLTGVWASAPYLHNGAVPTLAALLTPELRPRRFQVGGHALDFETLGLQLGPDGGYLAGYRPFSTPAWTDTSAPGLGAQGHRFGESLDAAQKRQLIEYLKGL
jgi:mono/diheme cytochrome c family protein